MQILVNRSGQEPESLRVQQAAGDGDDLPEDHRERRAHTCRAVSLKPAAPSSFLVEGLDSLKLFRESILGYTTRD